MSSTFKYQEGHLDILLAQMVRSPTLLESAISAQLDGRHLVHSEIKGSPAQAVIFRAIVEYYEKHGMAPDEAVIKAEVDYFVDSHVPSPGKKEEYLKKLGEFICVRKLVTEKSEALARDLIVAIAEICVFRPAAKETLRGAAETGDIDGLGKQILDLEAKQSSVKGGRSHSGILDTNLEEAGERVATLIPWIDSCTGNGSGPVNGSAVGIIAPQNGGKTTFGIQLAVAQALGGNHALLVLAEEGMTRSMRNKILGCALGLDYTLFEKNSIDSVVKNAGIDNQKTARKLSYVDEYLHWLDMVKDNTMHEGAAPILAEIGQLRSRGKKPTYVYVDWAGILADAVMQTTKRTKEMEIQSLSYTLAQEAYRSNCIIAVSQQMAADVVKRGPFNRPDMYCAADCRMFTAPMKYAIAVNKQDPVTGNSLLTWVKSRDDGILGNHSVMCLRGELAAFYDVSDRFEMKGKRFFAKHSDKRDSNKVPSEHGKKLHET